MPDDVDEDSFVAAVAAGRGQRLDLSRHERAPALIAALSRPSTARSTAVGVREVRVAGLDPAGAAQLAGARLPCVEVLHLSRLQCRAPCLAQLVGSELLSEVSELRLEGFFGPAEARALTADGTLQGLEHLSIYGMWDLSERPEDVLGDEGAKILASAPLLRTVRRLELPTHGIGDTGAAALAGSSQGEALRQLSLRGNDIADAGASALMEGTVTRALERLDLRDNPLSPAIAATLREHYGSRVTLSP